MAIKRENLLKKYITKTQASGSVISNLFKTSPATATQSFLERYKVPERTPVKKDIGGDLVKKFIAGGIPKVLSKETPTTYTEAVKERVSSTKEGIVAFEKKPIEERAETLVFSTMGGGLKDVGKKLISKLSIGQPIKSLNPIKPSPALMTKTKGFIEKPIADPVDKLTALIKQSKPKRGALEKQYTAERARRIKEVETILAEGQGEAGYVRALSKLKGKLASDDSKVVFDPIKEKLSQPEVNDLFNRIFKHPYLDEFEKISASNEVTKLFVGELPTPKGLTLLEEVYGTDLIKNILAKRSLGFKIKDTLIDAMNLPRAFMATADMSGFLRQGIIPVVAHPKVASKAMKHTFKVVFSQKNFNRYFDDLVKDPQYPLMRKSKLAITDPRRFNASEREEAFLSRLAGQVPIVGHVVRASERAYVGFLNKLRVDLFKTWSDELLSKGLSPIKDEKMFKSIAEVINTFTGRGSLGNLNRITPALNNVFFSPRLIAARFNALNPVWYAKMPPEIRKKALSDFGKFVAAGTSLLAVAKASGFADVEVNPKSSDFGKIKIGNTRWDIWGGFQQWTRVMTQVVTGERKSATSGKIVKLNKEQFPFTTRKDTALSFIEGKLAPVPALVRELIDGAKTFEGEDLTLKDAALTKLIPMYLQDLAEAYEDGGIGRVVGAGIPAFFGVGVQTYKGRTRESLFDKYSSSSQTSSREKLLNKYSF